MTYYDLTDMTPEQRKQLFRENIRPVTYTTEDGKTISAEDLPKEERAPLTEPPMVKDWEPHVIEKKRTAPLGRGRPSRKKRRELLFEMYPDWVVTTVEKEMGVPVESVSAVEFEAVLKAVSLEKGWVLK